MVVSAALWKQVMFLDSFTCVYCGEHNSELTVDHFIPASLGGPDVIQNLVAACAECNSIKQARAPYECNFAPRFGRYAYVVKAVENARLVKTAPRFSTREFARLVGMPETTLRRKLAEIDGIDDSEE